jgi:hypothetical protein
VNQLEYPFKHLVAEHDEEVIELAFEVGVLDFLVAKEVDARAQDLRLDEDVLDLHLPLLASVHHQLDHELDGIEDDLNVLM